MAKTEQMTKTKKAPAQVSPSVNGARLDTRFIGQPHEWDPRRLYSQTAADWQYRVDFDRLRRERLAKLQEQMVALGQIPKAGDVDKLINPDIRKQALARIGK